MFNARMAHPSQHTDNEAEAHRHAYNTAFAKLGLSWHWDAATFFELTVQGRDGVRTYLQTEQPHLLRAYEVDFLVEAIETAKASCYAGVCRDTGQRPAWSALSTNGINSQRVA